MNGISGALLAGGKSRRMGTDKCLLEIEGEPLWRRGWKLLGEITARRWVVAPQRPGWWAGEWLPDEGCGPLGGVAAALEAAEGNVLVLAVDLPGMTAGYLRRLAEAADPECGVVPEMDGLYQPLSAVYPQAARLVVREHLRQEDKSLQSVLRELIAKNLMKSVPVAAEERGLFRNLNRPAD